MPVILSLLNLQANEADKELAKAINLDLKLHKALNDIENQLIEDPLNVISLDI